MEEDVLQSWRELFYSRAVTVDVLDRGEELLDRLRPESPLRSRLARELEDLRRIDASNIDASNNVESRRSKEPAFRPTPKSRPQPPRQPTPPKSAEVLSSVPDARESTPPVQKKNERRIMRKEEILAKLAAQEIDVDEATKLLSELDKKKGGLSCRVSQKGAISVYGLQRMPVTLYSEQWERLLNFSDDIREFSKDHDSELKKKETAAPQS